MTHDDQIVWYYDCEHDNTSQTYPALVETYGGFTSVKMMLYLNF